MYGDFASKVAGGVRSGWEQSMYLGLPDEERFFLRARLRWLGMTSLRAYYQTAHWRAFTKRVRKKTCQECGKAPSKRGKGLQVHHLTYRRLGAERASDVVTLCSFCHRAAHGLPKRRRRRRKPTR